MNGISIACTGRLGGDPEQRFSANGQAMLVFSLAVDENTTATEDRQPETLWLRCTAWGELSESLTEQLAKGRAIYVEGRLRHGKWQTASGEDRCGLNVSCWKVEIHGSIGRRAPKREAAGMGSGGEREGSPF
jgi:single-strand DNA-binding protein